MNWRKKLKLKKSSRQNIEKVLDKVAQIEGLDAWTEIEKTSALTASCLDETCNGLLKFAVSRKNPIKSKF